MEGAMSSGVYEQQLIFRKTVLGGLGGLTLSHDLSVSGPGLDTYVITFKGFLDRGLVQVVTSHRHHFYVYFCGLHGNKHHILQ